MLTAEQMLENWGKFLGWIEEYIPGERGKKLHEFYSSYEERFILLPASTKKDYHNCFAGGYVEHVNRVVEAALKIDSVWREMGVKNTYTTEELVFSALNHDLGKFGDLDCESVFPNTNDWEVKNRGILYKYNPELNYMSVPDRGLYILSQLGIKVSLVETLSIKLHDGLYDEANKPYLITYYPESKLRSSLPHIIHQADLLAARVEFERDYKLPTSEPIKQESKPKVSKQPIKTKALSSIGSDSLKDVMSNFFND